MILEGGGGEFTFLDKKYTKIENFESSLHDLVRDFELKKI